MARALAYWRARLAGAPVLELPTVQARPAVQGHAGATYRWAWPDALARAVEAVSRREGVTPFMTVLAVLTVVLHRYTGQTDVVVGTPISGRHQTEVEGLIGLFLNTLVLRTDVAGNPRFRELLTRVRTVALEAYEHQELPFERLVEVVQPERDLRRTPLFQVLLVVQHSGRPTIPLSGVRVTPERIDAGRAKFDLTLFVTQTPGAWEMALEYRTELFDEGFVARVAGHLTRVCEQVVGEPDVRVGALTLLTAAERRQVVDEWNATAPAVPAVPAVEAWVEQQVAARPDAVAVVSGETALTYDALNRRSNQLARWLRRTCGAPERVALLCDRSSDMVVGLLGSLKAGAAYVPLDPMYPDGRVRFMLQDARPQVVVTQARWAPRVAAAGLPVVCLDRRGEALAAAADTNLGVARRGADLLYIIYTSGSTGVPKGIALPQRAMGNLLAWYGATRPAAARTLQYASLSFDMASLEILSALCGGGTVVLVEPGLRQDLSALARFLTAQAVDTVMLPVTVADHLARELGRSRGPSPVRAIITAGEQLQVTPALVELATRTGCALHNFYGPSETHVVTAHQVAGAPATWPGRPPIGRPIAHTAIYLVDGSGELAPVGVPGELYIGGVGLAQGYWQRPGLTATRFVADAFSGRPGARLYRTGDVARWQADGTLEYLGRRDDQVKIRGYRVEVGEVEAVLAQCPGVDQAVVTVRGDAAQGTRLAAYVVGT
ncbi:MAG TPA: amino acid adenylation domain-containing protein, partial [Gemmatimonadales bacterium]|nr:amino acid adenylation domain-containing protein [Gemmatimonadales bacterium]